MMHLRIIIIAVATFLFFSCAEEKSNGLSTDAIVVDDKSKQSDSSGQVSVPMAITQDTSIDLKKEKIQNEVKEEITEAKKVVTVVKSKKPSLISKISFSNPSFDFGRLVQGEKVLHEYTFTNVGKAPLVIKNAVASCGCTQPIYPFIPIEPGDAGKILVQFNSTGRLGRQSSSIQVVSNGDPSTFQLRITGEVITEEFRDTTKL